MPRLIDSAALVDAVGNQPIRIEEFVGRVNTQDGRISVARITCPPRWIEPGQRPGFLEITLVLSGRLRIEYAGGTLDVGSGQAAVTEPGEWVRYSTGDDSGADYIAVCLPAYSLPEAHRDACDAPAAPPGT